MSWRSERLSSESLFEMVPLLGIGGASVIDISKWLQAPDKRGLVGIARHRGPYIGAFAFHLSMDGAWPLFVVPWIICVELTHRRRTFAALLEQIGRLAAQYDCPQIELQEVRGQNIDMQILFRRPPWRCQLNRAQIGVRIDTISLRKLRSRRPPLIDCAVTG